MKLLKKLQSNSGQSQNLIGRLSEEFDFNAKPSFLRAKSFNKLPKSTSKRAHSGLSGKEF